MKALKLWLTGMMLGLNLVVVTVHANCGGITEGLVACYPFDEDANDASGNLNHGIPQADIRFVEGKVGRAAEFSGTAESYIRVANPVQKFDNEFTVAGWVLSNDRGGIIFTKYSWAAAGGGGKGFSITGSDDLTYGASGSAIATGVLFNTSGDSGKTVYDISPGIFHHFSVTYDYGTSRTYINGELKIEKDIPHNGSLDNKYDMLIGAFFTNDGNTVYPGSFFDGLLDELRIYNRALTAAEIQTLYAGEPETPVSTNRCSSTDTPAVYDLDTQTVNIPAVDIAVLHPWTGLPTGEIAVFRFSLAKMPGVDDFQIIADSVAYLGSASAYDPQHARYEYNDSFAFTGAKLKLCVLLESVVVVPPGIRIAMPPTRYAVTLRQLAIEPDIFHIEHIEDNDTPPDVYHVLIQGLLGIGETLTGTYLFYDPDLDSERDSQYRWQRADTVQGANATDIPDATAVTYTLSDADNGKYLRFCITPSDGMNFGTEVCSPWVGQATASSDTLRFELVSDSTDEHDGIATVRVIREGTGDGIVSMSYTIEYDNNIANNDTGCDPTVPETASSLIYNNPVNGQDYTLTDGPLSWADGDMTEKNLSIPLHDDNVWECGKIAYLSVTDASGAAVETPLFIPLTIHDNDAPSPPVGGTTNKGFINTKLTVPLGRCQVKVIDGHSRAANWIRYGIDGRLAIPFYASDQNNKKSVTLTACTDPWSSRCPAVQYCQRCSVTIERDSVVKLNIPCAGPIYPQ